MARRPPSPRPPSRSRVRPATPADAPVSRASRPKDPEQPRETTSADSRPREGKPADSAARERRSADSAAPRQPARGPVVRGPGSGARGPVVREARASERTERHSRSRDLDRTETVGEDPPSSAGDAPRTGVLVPAADRFRDLVRARPWRRRRRTIIAVGAAVLVLVLAALACLLFLPAFRAKNVEVTGTGYVDQGQIAAAVAPGRDGSVLLLPTGDLERRAEAVPGVRSAHVVRAWPDGMRVEITERTPLAVVTDSAGAQKVVDEDGVTLPPAAAKGRTLTTLAVGAGSSHPEAATSSMLEVLAALPEDLRASVTGISATTASDVTLTIHTEKNGDKTVVWGDAKDSDLKAKAVAALLDQPGTTIDVSSPVAPVTR